MAAGVGLLAGASRYGTYGMSRWNTVAAARFGTERPASRLPYWPKAVVAGSAFALLVTLKGCPELWARHWLAFALLLSCCLSTAAWLLMASGQREVADARRAELVEQFLEDPAAPVPPREPGLQELPGSLRQWNWLNIMVFFLVIGGLAAQLFISTTSEAR